MTMKRRLKTFVLANVFASLCLLASHSAMAQTEQNEQQADKAANLMGYEVCPDKQKFTFGSGASGFAFCVSDHGNVLELDSPVGFNQISVLEGYVACGTGVANAYDAGSDSYASGWNNPTAVTQPGGPHTLPLSLTRKSTDGKLQLQQSFDWDTTNKEITVTMVLKNVSGAPITNVKLARYFLGNVDGSAFGDFFDADSDSVWGKDFNTYAGHAVMLSALSLALTHRSDVETFSAWYSSYKTCTPVPQPVPTTTAADYVGRLTFNLGTINAGVSKTVKVLYKRF
jgi:hypothetical protein